MPDVDGLPTQDEVLAWHEELSNWGRWGEDDQLGTLNLVTPPKRVAAAGLVTEGITVSCARDIDTAPTREQRVPPQRHMIATGEGLADPHRPVAPGQPAAERGSGALEWLGLQFHGYSITHLDGLSHIFWDGLMYNGKPAGLVTSRSGATHHGVEVLADGVVTRGVLLDVAALRGVPWLEPGDAVLPGELEAAEERQGVRVEEGDALLLRTGYGRRRVEQGPEDVPAVGRAGYHAACLPWLHQRGVAVVGSDTAQDAVPSGYPDVRMPIHTVGIVAMGLWLLDNCGLEDLAATCERLGRWTFQLTLAPLRVVGATGSPANPIAAF